MFSCLSFFWVGFWCALPKRFADILGLKFAPLNLFYPHFVYRCSRTRHPVSFGRPFGYRPLHSHYTRNRSLLYSCGLFVSFVFVYQSYLCVLCSLLIIIVTVFCLKCYFVTMPRSTKLTFRLWPQFLPHPSLTRPVRILCLLHRLMNPLHVLFLVPLLIMWLVAPGW